MIWNTFKGWREEGYWVSKGEKSMLRCPKTNIPLFHEDQVVEVGLDLYGEHSEHSVGIDT